MKTGLRRLMTLLMTLLFVLNTVSVGFATETNYSESISLESILPEVEPTDGDAAPAAEGDETVTEGETEETAEDVVIPTGKHSIIINYVFADGESAANSWTSTIEAGGDINITVTSPAVLGYEPDQATVEVNIQDIAEDKTYTVTYSAALVKYTVKHYQQNLSDDKYTLYYTDESKTGYTKSQVGGNLAETYEGFTALLYDTTTEIAADGSTVVEIYYDRNYYLMSFDLDGGYGVDPIYARYGADIEVGTPTKEGYTFDGWQLVGTETVVDSIPYTTMPAANLDYKAKWSAETVNYTVVFWYENADDTNYTSVGSITATAPAGSEVSSELHKDSNFTNKDADHFTYNANKVETVTVKGDGSTILNVYFTRNTYTITFVGDVLTCTKTEHEHSYSCCKYGGTSYDHWYHRDSCCSLGLSEHTHGNSCYDESTIKTVTAKYDSDITTVWTTDPIKSLLDDGYVFKSSVTEKYYSFLEKMHGYDITMTATLWSGDTYKWYYYLEVLPGKTYTETTRTDGGKTYYEYDSTTVKGEGLSLTYEEDYYDITGFTQRDDEVPEFNNGVAYLYYTRNSYKLSFHNHGTTVEGKGGTFLYEADISGQNFTPEYPSTLEEGAYTFDGWYTSPFFGDTKFNFTNATMPANDVILYARWVPVTHDVTFWLTEDTTETGTVYVETQKIAHRETVEEPEDPVNGEYVFVGWFYKDENGKEHAFSFGTQISKDMDIYAKWSSNKLMQYTIKYALADGTIIAEDTVGTALAGTTKTFDAKAGSELYVGYQSGYYPNTNSHSITIDIEDPAKNTFTFIYTPKEKVNYVVRYLEVGTEKVLHEQKNASTRDAVITENFEPVTGYRPDAYQKRLVLSADESQNVITFWYVVDTVHAPVKVIHYIQNAEGEEYTVYQEATDLNGVIGQLYSTDILTITGYTFKNATAETVDGTTAQEVAVTETTVAGTVTESGLLLELYYNRNLYPYEFKFLEQGTEKVLAESVTGTARYGSQVTQTAKVIPGYTLQSSENQAITIAVEEGTSAVNNVRIFYYTENQVTYNYYVVGPEGCGYVGLGTAAGTERSVSETIASATGDPEGSTATANANYKFVGWFKDEACTDPVSAADATLTGNHLDPLKNADGIYTGGNFYAKFELDTTTVTIEKIVAGNMGDRSKTFNFTYSATRVGETTAALTGTFSLSHLGTYPIENVPIGATLIITETNASGYTITAEASKGEVAVDEEQYTVTATVAADTGKITITNTLDGTPDTGILLDSLPYVLILAAVGAALVLWFIRKRRVED